MNEKILVVEDNPSNMRLIEMILRGRGYNLLKAVDGEEALEITNRERPDLIIMDIQLPKLNGLEAIRRIRQVPVFSITPIIALTAYAMKGGKERILSAGCDTYLSKPINTRELLLVIADLLQHRRKKSMNIRRDGDGEKNPCH